MASIIFSDIRKYHKKYLNSFFFVEIVYESLETAALEPTYERSTQWTGSSPFCANVLLHIYPLMSGVHKMVQLHHGVLHIIPGEDLQNIKPWIKLCSQQG